jgi:acyl-coenzyme A synthetase/AMP-(fatty) acid ligase
VKPGNRFLIRSANNPAMIACWLAATKAGAVVVNTMPMPRAEELTKIVDKAEIKLALCDTRILDELVACAKRSSFLKKRRRGTLATLAIRSLSSPTRAGRPTWWISGALASGGRAGAVAGASQGETTTIVDVARALRAVGTAKARQRRGAGRA